MKTDGTVLPADFQIHYTLDGTDPVSSSPVYGQPFVVPASCTVKAVAFLDGRHVLTMEETFDPEFGLHWSAADETPDSDAPSTALQAVTAEFRGAHVARAGKGFLGTGYLDFKGAEGRVAFYQENDGPAGTATLVICYAHADPDSKRPLAVVLNGTQIAIERFPATGSWTGKWKTVRIPCNIRSGANQLLLQTTGQSAPNLDQVEFR